MKILKKVIVVVVALFAMSVSFANGLAENQTSLFANIFKGCTFFSPEQVIDAYKGSWQGTQVMTVNGRQVATALVEQNYIPTDSAGKTRLIGTGKITGMGTSIPTRSYIYVDNGVLRLDIRTQDGENVGYIGIFSDNKIEWVPRYFVMTFDLQIDTFVNSSEGMKISSCGIKYVEIKQSGFEGYIQVDCTFRKSEVVFPKEKVNTSKNAKFVFPSAKMGE